MVSISRAILLLWWSTIASLIKAHRKVLAEASPFFEKLLDSDMKESNKGVVRLEMFTESVMRKTLGFIYTWYCSDIEWRWCQRRGCHSGLFVSSDPEDPGSASSAAVIECLKLYFHFPFCLRISLRGTCIQGQKFPPRKFYRVICRKPWRSSGNVKWGTYHIDFKWWATC